MFPARFAGRGLGSALASFVQTSHIGRGAQKAFHSNDGTTYYTQPGDGRQFSSSAPRAYVAPTAGYSYAAYPTGYGYGYGYAYGYPVAADYGGAYTTAVPGWWFSPAAPAREYSTEAAYEDAEPARAARGGKKKDSIQSQVRKRLQQDMKEASYTINLTEEEKDSNPSHLTFEQLERRILHQFEINPVYKVRLAWLHELLHKAEKPEELQRAMDVMLVFQSRMIEFTETTAGGLINAAIRVQAPEKALDALKPTSPLVRLYPTTGSLNHLMIAFAARQPADLERLREAFQVVRSRSQLNSHSFEVLIRALVNEKKVPDALKAAYEAQKMDIPMTRFTYSLLMKGCTDHGRPEDILVLEEMMRDGHQPNSTELMYTVLARLIVEKEVAGAAALLNSSDPKTAEAAVQKLLTNLAAPLSSSSSTSDAEAAAPTTEENGIAPKLSLIIPLLPKLADALSVSAEAKERLRTALA
eukprot:TRINITY_DN807_c0_g1_i2.p1 TRINITY_DN807_c0_g1~~TRINITY_DN807_c0_g1_i2.p1  ORF type:complete len:470 (-),score=184.67 TRINITY_DN807_c0_g1_i2:416-1825(-)